MYASAAQYNAPPRYPVTMVCKGIDGAPKGSDVIGRIAAGVESYRGEKTCYNMSGQPSQTSVGWGWQVRYLYSIIPLHFIIITNIRL